MVTGCEGRVNRTVDAHALTPHPQSTPHRPEQVLAPQDSYTGTFSQEYVQASLRDPDGTVADWGFYAGSEAHQSDLDLDGRPGYFWPGTLEDAPAGFDPRTFDADDLKPWVP